MFHVSFRYIFGIPPLILVLLPVASSDCDIEGKDGGVYQNVLMVSIDDLDRMIDFDSNCLNNEPNFLKKHSCDDNKEASFLYRAARKLKQFIKMNISEEFNHHLSTVSQGTLTLFNCTSKLTTTKNSEAIETRQQFLQLQNGEKYSIYIKDIERLKEENHLPWVKPNPLRIWKKINL